MLEYRQEDDRSNHGVSVEEREDEVVVKSITGGSFGFFESGSKKVRAAGQ
jgi:hypothetical protein